MAIEKLSLLHINFAEKNLLPVLAKLDTLTNFDPILASKISTQVSGLKTLRYENSYETHLNRLNEVCDYLKINIIQSEPTSLSFDEKAFDAMVNELMDKTKTSVETRDILVNVNADYQDAITYAQHLENTDFTLDEIFGLNYVKVRFGRLPIDYLSRLSFYDKYPFIFKKFYEDKAYAWCMYLMPIDNEGDIDNIFASLQFERVRIPDFFHGKPADAIAYAKEEIVANEKMISKIEDGIQEIKREYLSQIQVYYNILTKLKHLNSLTKYVVDLGNGYQIMGYTPERSIESVNQYFGSLCEVDNFPAESDQRFKVPTKLKNNWFVRPFELFVDMYGLPNYEDIDPTPFVALTYTLLFGIMFADVGQGLVLSLLCFILIKTKKMPIAEIGLRIGFASAFFGVIFGSIFGNEEILHHFFHETLNITFLPIIPLDSNYVMPILIATVTLGIVLITLSISMNIILKVKNKHYAEAVLSHNGVAGLVLYLSVLIGAALQLAFNVAVFNPIYITCLIVIPFLLIFFKEPIEHYLKKQSLFPTGFGDFMITMFFEMFEILLSYISNTISFLRVGGFVIAHAGMMVVVYVLAGMTSGIGAFLILVIGNIFVMALEIMIVGIQVLRLEFYEIFSRYFEGDGIAFEGFKQNN